MVETIGIEVLLGLEANQLQAELIKAENQLKQFQNQLKRSTDTTQIAQLQKAIGNLNGTISNVNVAMGNTAKKTGDATQSLINMSRIAQDAPYGFIGISNNLNPMLESFQQLAKTEGGTKKALTAMIDGLSGPAGLGVALGIASSLLVVFSKQITAAFEGSADKLKGLREELKKLNEDVFKIAGAAQSSQTLGTILVGKATDTNNSIEYRKNALKKFIELYKDNAEVQSLDIKELNKYNQQYLQSINNRAAVQQLEIGKTDNYTQALSAANAEYKKLVKERDDLIKNVSPTLKQQEAGITKKMLEDQIKASYVQPLKNAKLEIDAAKAALSGTVNNLLNFGTPDKKGKKEKDAFAEELADETKRLRYEMFQRKQMIDKLKDISSPILMEKPEDKAKREKQRLAGIKLFGESKMTGDFGESLVGKTSAFYEETKKGNDIIAANINLTKQQTEAYWQMADTISNFATNAVMGLWASMEQGMSLGEALGNMFMDLAKQIAAAAIKALAFQAILSLIPGAQGAGIAAGSFTDIFKRVLGLADGGIVTGPTLAMVGEGNESEAVLPLSKLGGIMQTTFNAGSMASNSRGGGEFILRGSDLVLATQRANVNLNYRRG